MPAWRVIGLRWAVPTTTDAARGTMNHPQMPPPRMTADWARGVGTGQDHDRRDGAQRSAAPVGGQRPRHQEDRLGDDRDGGDLEAVDPASL